MSRFERYRNQVLELKISGEDEPLKMKPTAKDQELFLLIKKPDSNEMDSAKITSLLTNMIMQANPGETEADVKDFLGFKYQEVLREFMISMGMASREDFETKKP